MSADGLRQTRSRAGGPSSDAARNAVEGGYLLLSVARVGVFFIDDLQAVKRDESGTADDIERLAVDHGAEVHEFELEALLRHRADEGHTARLVAGYCWPWSSPLALVRPARGRHAHPGAGRRGYGLRPGR